MARILPLVVVLALVLAVGSADAGGKLTLKSLDKRVRALTALVLLDERSPAQLETRKVSASTGRPDAHGIESGTAYCPPGDWTATGGGAETNNLHAEASVLNSTPDFVLEAWDATIYTPGPNDIPGTVWVVCTHVATP